MIPLAPRRFRYFQENKTGATGKTYRRIWCPAGANTAINDGKVYPRRKTLFEVTNQHDISCKRAA
jgi:hypothetical protein